MICKTDCRSHVTLPCPQVCRRAAGPQDRIQPIFICACPSDPCSTCQVQCTCYNQDIKTTLCTIMKQLYQTQCHNFNITRNLTPKNVSILFTHEKTHWKLSRLQKDAFEPLKIFKWFVFFSALTHLQVSVWEGRQMVTQQRNLRLFCLCKMVTTSSLERRWASDRAKVQIQEKRLCKYDLRELLRCSFCVVLLQLRFPRLLQMDLVITPRTAKKPKVPIFIPYIVLRMYAMLQMMMNEFILFVVLTIR